MLENGAYGELDGGKEGLPAVWRTRGASHLVLAQYLVFLGFALRLLGISASCQIFGTSLFESCCYDLRCINAVMYMLSSFYQAAGCAAVKP